MTAEIFKIKVPGQTFVFLVTQTDERLQFLGRELGEIGGSAIGPQAYVFRASMAPEAIRDALGDLEYGECAYLIDMAEGVIESRLIVPPRQ